MKQVFPDKVSSDKTEKNSEYPVVLDTSNISIPVRFRVFVEAYHFAGISTFNFVARYLSTFFIPQQVERSGKGAWSYLPAATLRQL